MSTAYADNTLRENSGAFAAWNLPLANSNSCPRSWNKRGHKRPPRAFFAVVFDLYREIRRLPAVPELKLDHVLFPLREKGFA
jgi:hypothetical protein